MKNSFLWHDANIDKPATSDPVLGLTSHGYIVIVQYFYNRGKNERWYEYATDEGFDDIVFWSDFKLPHGWNISDDYYEE